VTSAKRKRIIRLSRLWAHLTGTSHLPQRGLTCERCGKTDTDHLICWDTDLDLADFAPQVELHDAALRVERGAA